MDAIYLTVDGMRFSLFSFDLRDRWADLGDAENERLPTELGWTTSSREFTSTDLDNMMEKIVNATGATPEEARRFLARGDLHAGRSRCAELRV